MTTVGTGAHRFSPEEYQKFNQVGEWIADSLVGHDKGLEDTLTARKAGGLDDIDVAPNEGKFLYLLARIRGARSILEIGTLGGYSAIWFAKAVGPSGKVISLELEPHHADIAVKNIKNAGFSDVVEVKVGAALDTLEGMAKEKQDFDMVFIDADKENNVNYVKHALSFSHSGTIIVVDNVVRQGRVLVRYEKADAACKGVLDVFRYMKEEKRLDCTALQTVGPKGWDGFSVALVVE